METKQSKTKPTQAQKQEATRDERVLLIAPTGLTVFKDMKERNTFTAMHEDAMRGTAITKTPFTFSSRHAELSPFIPNAMGLSRSELWEAACKAAMTPEQRVEWVEIGKAVSKELSRNKTSKATTAADPAPEITETIKATTEETVIPVAPAGDIVSAANGRGAVVKTMPLRPKSPGRKGMIVRARSAAHQAQKDQAKESVSGFMRAGILAGKTNSEIFKEAKAKFGLDDKKSGYPAWYRSQMKRKGEL